MAFTIARPFRDNGHEAELVGKSAASVRGKREQRLGDCWKLDSLRRAERKAVVVRLSLGMSTCLQK